MDMPVMLAMSAVLNTASPFLSNTTSLYGLSFSSTPVPKSLPSAELLFEVNAKVTFFTGFKIIIAGHISSKFNFTLAIRLA